MIPIWLGKMIATRVIKAVKHKIDLKKIDKYVNKPNELDLQARAHARALDKYGRTIEELEKDVAILKKDSHPPIFAKNDYKKILRRLNKLEKKER
tara:strand:+ start:94 stop:378 length:285 start_codon:yes stop_codon:yes gene_type:complete